MPADRRTCRPGFSASHAPLHTVEDGMSRRAGGCAPEIPTGQAERINAVHRGHQMRRAICCGRVPRHLTPVDIRCMHYIASCAPPNAAIRLPAEYFFPSPCSLKSVSRPEVHTLRSTIRPRQAPCSCRLCQRVVREGHLSVLAPNREVLVMSPFWFPFLYILRDRRDTIGALHVYAIPLCGG